MFRPVGKPRVAEEIVSQLRGLILRGDYAVGDKLPPERRLAEELGVNRASLREAIKSLEHMGLVKTRQGDGTRVLDFMQTAGVELVSHLIAGEGAPNLQVLLDVLDFRRWFGRETARLAAERATADDLKKLEQVAIEADARYAAAAKKLSMARQKSAEKLNKAVNAELAPLKLERAKFMTQVETDETAPGPQGFDRVEFWVQTNPGTKPGPLMKVASGGELSRFLLALKVVLSDRGSAPTLVFDEIDTGVGGAVADAIGTRLARLASRVQVMAVTHAPQVAARAGQHLLISKDALDKGKRVANRVNALAADHRREEVARMLAGAESTAEARAAADRLLKAAS